MIVKYYRVWVQKPSEEGPVDLSMEVGSLLAVTEKQTLKDRLNEVIPKNYKFVAADFERQFEDSY